MPRNLTRSPITAHGANGEVAHMRGEVIRHPGEDDCVNLHELIQVPLTYPERHILRSGLVEWGGPAQCTEEFAIAMGFKSVADLHVETMLLVSRLDAHEPLSGVDWVRALVATEVVFASDVVGSGSDWVHTVGVTDVETIALLRALQRKIPIAGVLGIAFGTRPNP